LGSFSIQNQINSQNQVSNVIIFHLIKEERKRQKEDGMAIYLRGTKSTTILTIKYPTAIRCKIPIIRIVDISKKGKFPPCINNPRKKSYEQKTSYLRLNN
jgi:hypothetical protein